MELITLTLPRVYLLTETLGSIYLPDGLLLAKTMELPWRDNRRAISCIPEDTYLVRKEPPKQGRDYWHYRIPEVPDRYGILMHPISFVKDLKGCIGVGSRFFDLNKDGIPDMAESKKKLQYMIESLPDEFYLNIFKKAA